LGASEFNTKGGVINGIKNWVESNMSGTRKITSTIAPLLRQTGLIRKRKNVTDIPLDQVKYLMETNFYGPWRLSQIFLPLLEKSENGRIINMSSGMGELKDLDGEYPAYRISKSSLNALTIMLAEGLKGKRISVNAMCPGWVKTDMGGPDAPRTVEQGADTAVWLATEEVIPTGKFFRDRREIDW
jgi:NAD(P)-dependent dehydrogenase (short-subunit alcohol dehydrogenase family)